MRRIELLAPARDADCGMEALRHGADAVYIGGPAFGARAAATNSVDDIRQLCDFAHLFEAKVYVTLNTILWDSELAAAERVIAQLYEAGTDALIVQDPGLLKLDLPPIALHASTQMDNRTPDQARLLEQLGFSQIVLARELSLADMAAIHQAVHVPLEAFVHGALCVSYSGRCYASQFCFGRSANRGCCAQFCRLSFDLVDGDGRVAVADRHLLSLRDMNRSEDLEAMMDAGISSFKIEGRLKDAGYVKNVTAAYRQRIDDILNRRSDDYARSSKGTSAIGFQPDLNKSFNRGFTDYFLHGQRTADLQNIITPKAMGERVGSVERVDRRTGRVGVSLLPGVSLTAGDGLCFIADGRLQGFRANRVEGNAVFPAGRVYVARGTALFRNQDASFDHTLSRPTAVRTLWLDITLDETPTGYALTMTDETQATARIDVEAPHETARTPQAERIGQQLRRMGNTPFTPRHVSLHLTGNRFIPNSTLADWRRRCTELLLERHRATYVRDRRRPLPATLDVPLPARLDYEANVANAKARALYAAYGVTQIDKAFELAPKPQARLMTCKYCIRAALGACLKRPEEAAKLKEPLMLRLPDGRRFRLSFDCHACQMSVYATS